MDNHYDFDGAALAINKFAEERCNSDIVPLSSFSVLNDVNTILIEQPLTWKIIVGGTDGLEVEELVFCIQGVLAQKDLPPIPHHVQRNPKQRFLRQSVQITGLNTHLFQKSIDSLHQIHDLLSRSIPQNKLDNFKPDSVGDYLALNLATRYFTSRRDDPFGPALPFQKSCDPNGVLASMLNDQYFHGNDNEVLYYSLIPQSDTGTSCRFEAVQPTQFHVGDVVEAQMTVIAVQVKDRFKMILQLRSLAFIDSSFAKKASLARFQTRPSSFNFSHVQKTLKRKIGYADEDKELSKAQRCLQNMELQE